MVVQKHTGSDCELSTTGIDADGRSLDSWNVTRACLRWVPAAAENFGTAVWLRDAWRSDSDSSYSGSAYSQDCLRNWLSNGMCMYADMAHFEVCTPTTLYPRAFAAQNIATLMIAEKARQFAEEAAEPGVRYELSASNADVMEPRISFGSHKSVSISEELFENLYVDPRYPAVLGFVASAMAAAAAFFGAGYLLPTEDDGVIFSLSARAHHITRLQTLSTTEPWRRGLLNSRRESHATSQDRFHWIAGDNSIISAALSVSFLQCVLAAAEHGYCGLNLRDPVGALQDWSWNLDMNTGKLPATATLVDGRRLTLPVYTCEVCQTLLNMCEAGLIEEAVAPEAQLMLPRIIELTQYVKEGSLDRCAVHLDWAAKTLQLLSLGGRFEDAAMRLADHDFTNTNPRKGAFWWLWEEGRVDPLVDLDEVLNCTRNAPPESRDWGRGRLIERFSDSISAVDWSYIELYLNDGNFSPRVRVDFPKPGSLNRTQFEHIIRNAGDVEDVRDLLQARDNRQPLYANQDADFPPR
jgi:Pup amidohydrolase